MSSENPEVSSSSTPKRAQVSDVLRPGIQLEEVINIGAQLLMQEQQESVASLEAAQAAYTDGSTIELGSEGMDPDLAALFNRFGSNLRMQELMQQRQLVRTMGRLQVMLQAIGAYLVKVDAPATMEAATAAATPPVAAPPVETAPVA
jgi:hypothetical protein